MSRARIVAAALVAALIVGSCATTSRAPPVATGPYGEVTPGRVVWHDLVTEDLEAAKRFYGGVLGWTFEDFTSPHGPYALAALDGRPVAGILMPARRTVNVSQWVSYFSVPDVDAAASAAVAEGAKLVVPPTDVAGKGRAALLLDPQGAPVAFARIAEGDPVPAPPPVHGWLWIDLWTPDPAAAAAFYGKLLDLEARPVEGDALRTALLARGDKLYAGVIERPRPEIRPNWLPVLRVRDAEAAARSATEFGGKVLVAPRPGVGGGKAAILADPSGGAVAVLEWQVEQERAEARR